jgi:hypothetical protein
MMKRKLTAICALAVLLLVLSSSADASRITDLRDHNDNQLPFPPGPNFYPGYPTPTDGYLISDPDWGWTHTLDFAGSGPPSSITSATLEITHFGWEGAGTQHDIYLDGLLVGSLVNPPLEQTTTTVLNLDATAISNLTDGTADIYLSINYPIAIAIVSSKLIVDYVPEGLVSVTVSGPTQVNENSGAQYTCTASFNDGSSSDVTDSSVWSQNSANASIGINGFLTTLSVTSDEPAQVKASFGGMTDTIDVTIKNVKPTVSITAPAALASEPGFNGLFEVSRTGDTVEQVTVFFSRSGSTAVPGADYIDFVPPGQVVIPPGQSSESISVIVIDDDLEESTETVKLTLKPDPSYIIDPDPSLSSAEVTIDDDEPASPPQISGHIPAKSAIQAPRDTIIQVEITDVASGVDYKSVTIEVEDDVIYDGGNETSPGAYKTTSQTVNGICRRVDIQDGFMFVFQGSQLFDYDQQVDVEVNAADEAGNGVSDVYSFFTVMRTFGKNIKVNTDAGASAQNHPDSAVDSFSNIWVVWEHLAGAGNSDIYIGKLLKGTSTFETSRLVYGDMNNQLKPAVAIYGTDIYAVWQGDDPGGNWDIFFSSSPNGANWSIPQKINVDPLNKTNQTAPAIAVDENGNIYIAWVDDSKGASDKDIWAASSNNGWTAELVASAAGSQTEPVIDFTTDITGMFQIPYIFWLDQGVTDTDIFASKKDIFWSSPQLIVDTFSNQFSPDVTISNGTIHLLWGDDNNVIESIFYGTDEAGLPIIGASIVDEPGTFQTAPSIAAYGDRIFACWQDSRNVSEGNADTDIYYAEKGISGFGTNILVNDDTGTFTQTSPVINTDADGNPFMVWVDNREGNNDIYATAATSTGDVLQSTLVSPFIPTTQIVQVDESTDEIDGVDDVKIEIPGGALATSAEIRIAPFNNPPEPPAGAFGAFYELSPGGFEFLMPVTVTIPHKAADCPGHAEYRVFFYDPRIIPPMSPWSEEGITNVRHITDEQDPSLPSGLHVVQFDTTHFTAFGVGGGSAPAGGGGGGGGGGGCAVSAGGDADFAEFILPYIGFLFVLAILSVRDSGCRKSRSG